MKLLKSLALTFIIAALACSCGGKKKESNAGSKALSTAEIAAAKAYKHPLAEAYYKENPDFFVFSKPEDLPADLKWENGSDLPEVGSPKAKKGGTMNIALTDFPRTLRTRGPDTNGHMRSYLSDYVRIYLAHRHPDVEGWFPGLATDWSIDREKAIVYFKLNPKATYSDGAPITVDDFFFTFYFMRSPWIRAPYAAEFFSAYHSKLEKFDDHTFSISLKEPRPDLENYTLGMLPTPRHFYKDFGEDFVERYQWLAEPNSGCYVIGGDDLKKGRSVTLRRIENFWAKDLKHMRYRWNPDKLVIKAIRDPNKAFETFKKGDLDMARLNLAKYWYEQLPNDDPLVTNGYVHKSTFFQDVPQSGYRLWMNTSKPLLDDINVRLGLHHATNYELAIERFFRNDWIREQTASDGYADVSNSTIRSRKFSIPKAEEYFTKAGFTERGADGILVNAEGKRLSFTVSTGYKTMADLLTILRQEAKKAGVEYNIEILDGTSGWKKSQEKKHDITLSGFAGSPDELYPRYWDFFHSDNAYNEDGTAKANTNNLCCFGLPELDPIIDEYRTAKKHEDKVRLAHKIEEIVDEHGPFVPGAYPPSYRVGSWRWLQWPDDFNVNRSKIEQHWMLHWIDEDMKKETQAAMKSGKTFPPSVKDYDKFKPKL